MRLAAAIVCLVLTTTGCGAHLERTGGHSVGSKQLLQQVGHTPSPAPTDGPTTAPTARFTGPLFVLQLTDKNAHHPAGIPVRISGPVNAVQLTNSRGEIVLFQHGVYQFAVEQGCGKDVEVFSGGSGRAGVVDGQTQHGALSVDWRHRYTPAPPVFSNPSPRWAVGTEATISFKVMDRCTQQFAPNAPYPTFTFATSPNLKVSRMPTLRSNAKGEGSVTVKCLAKGDVTLVAVDSANPKDSFDIARESSDYVPPGCR